MPKPSIYRQVDARQIEVGPFMLPSPRHWNPGLIRYKGRLWMAYRYHLGKEHGSRCATALVPLDKSTFQPLALSQHLNLPCVVGDEHFEDARLFMCKGQPHISYTQMTGYRPGVNYACIIKYARLKLNGNRWLIDEVFYPQFGSNHGTAKEKNWAFFEYDGALHVIYQDQPTRKVIRLEGSRVVDQWESESAKWPWGHIRGGAPPVPHGNGQMLTIFHSSLPTEEPPHYVRYYGAAYMFEAKPPFRITGISPKPILAGSETDGHGFDPRYADGWKPWVVFPCGCVPPTETGPQEWLVSLGVNDWQCAVARIKLEQLTMIAPDRSDAPMRYFFSLNGSLQAKLVDSEGATRWLEWERAQGDARGGMVAPGIYATRDGREAEALEEMPRAEEITEEQYYAKKGGRVLV